MPMVREGLPKNRNLWMNDSRHFTVPEGTPSDRADRVIADCLSGELSRSALARLMRKGRVRVDGRTVSPASILHPGATIEIEPEHAASSLHPVQPVPECNILFEDDDIVVVDKPPGLVVHPAPAHPSGTLVDALVRERPAMVGVGDPGRWGVVHRLDKDTSGVMVVAKAPDAHASLSARFKEHSIHRIYVALVRGDPGNDEGIVATPLGRHPKDRKRISVSTDKPREALTGWRVLRRYGGLALLEVTPQTGRTHQIRVHLASIGLPVAGDPVYGRTRRMGSIKNPAIRKALSLLNRQALHAQVLGFNHPRTLQYVEFSCPVASDIQRVISQCQQGEERTSDGPR